MPAAVLPAQSSVLKDTPNGRRNVLNSSTKRRYDGTPVVNNLAPPKKYYNGRNLGSSQPKSHFEEEVLEKLTQNINGLKQKNAEKDQQWARPGLSDFDPNTQSLCFQQIEAEEGTLHGGKTTVKLFGCTEVSHVG
jgi:DNA polymerase delta subunit 1